MFIVNVHSKHFVKSIAVSALCEIKHEEHGRDANKARGKA